MASWEAARRLDFIDYRLFMHGHVRRADIMRTFGVSMPCASIDINEFIRLHPDAAFYNKTTKRYEPTGLYRTRRGMTEPLLLAWSLIWEKP